MYTARGAFLRGNLMSTTALLMYISISGGAEFSKSSTRWHLQRIVQRPVLSTDQVSSGSIPYDLAEISSELVYVYIIDTGIRIEHEEFTDNRASYGVNIENPGAPPTDCNGHGTHVAALAVGAFSGIAKNAVAISVRALDCSGTGLCSDVISALDYVLADTKQRGLKRSVAVLSVGSVNPTCAPTVQITQLLWNNGVVLTAAAGNNNTDACLLYPARNAGTIAVGAIDIDDKLYVRNNYGDCLDLFAPGVNVLSGWGKTSNVEYKTRTGTSMAAPIIAGMAAVMLGADPSLTPADVRNILVSSSTRNRILTSSGSQVMTQSVNRLAYAPWSRLFEETGMNGASVSKSIEYSGRSENETFPVDDKDWNSSASIVGISMTFRPKATPAMQYSVIRISSALSNAAGVRSASILGRRARGVTILSNGSEPKLIPLLFYIPMLPEFIEEYKSRLIQADADGSLSETSSESFSFAQGTLETALLINVSVPPLATGNETFQNGDRSEGGSGLTQAAVIGLVSIGVAVVLIAIVVFTVVVIVPHFSRARERREAVLAARNSAHVTVPTSLQAV